MAHEIKISDTAYSTLTELASTAGISPKTWVEKKINESKKDPLIMSHRRKKQENSNASLFDSMQSFIGAGVKLDKPHKGKIVPDEFGKILVKKFRRQGLKLEAFADDLD